MAITSQLEIAKKTVEIAVSSLAMVLGLLSVPWSSSHWVRVGQGPTVLAVGVVGGCLDIFLSPIPFLFSRLSLGRRLDKD